MAGHTSSDPNVFILPDLGEGVHEAELISWKVSPGDTVEEHQVVAEMETDKALVEVPSPRDGVIKELFGNPGDILNVGEPAWTYEGATTSGAAPAPSRVAEPAPAAKTTNGQAGHVEVEEPSADREDAGTVVGAVPDALGAVSATAGKALATPAVRRIARDLGVDIDSVSGTGLAGRVTEKDVRAAAQAGGAAPAPSQPAAPHAPAPQQVEARRAPSLATTVAPAPIERPATLVPTGDTERVPMIGVRRKIAERLRMSVDRAVHFSVMDDADVSHLNDVRKRVAAASGEKVSFLPFVASATMRALREFPALNAHIDDEAGEILRYPQVHLGIAADTDQGLSVPVIPNADMLGVLEIGRHITDIADAVRSRSIPADRLKGSTFTISNVGSYAGKYATPIINYPEVAILAAGRVFEGVVADKGAIRVTKLLPLSLTCDHRCVDGAAAARCLARIVQLLQSPEDLLTPARLA